MSETFSISLTVLTTLGLRGTTVDSDVESSEAFMTLGFLFVLKPTHFSCGPGLALVESETNGAKVVLQHVDDFWHHLGNAYKVDVIHVGETLHVGTDFLQEWSDSKAEQEWFPWGLLASHQMLRGLVLPLLSTDGSVVCP